MRKTTNMKNHQRPRLTGVYSGIGARLRHYTLILTNGGTEKMYCTQEEVQLRIHDESKPRVQYIDFKQR